MWALFIVPTFQSFASVEPRVEAENYIEEMRWFWPFWNNNPRIVSEKPFYSNNDETPSYIEYKVSCDDEVDCGYIMVNIDWTDVSVPVSSYAWKPPSEVMKEEKNFSWNEKNYYFNAFESFAYDESTWELWYTNPENKNLEQSNSGLTQGLQNSTMSRASFLPQNDKLKEKFEKFKKWAAESKEENIERQKTLNKSNTSSMSRTSTMARYWSDQGILRWSILWNWCHSLIPCYLQVQRYYPQNRDETWKWEWVAGCVPTALTMLMWYYDMNWYPDMVDWDAPITNSKWGNDSYADSVIRDLQIALWDTMWTKLVADWWSTNYSNFWKWIDYIKSKYPGWLSYDWHEPSRKIYPWIKEQIWMWKPVYLSISVTNIRWWHAVVAYWFKENRLIINMWDGTLWWAVVLNINANYDYYMTNYLWNSLSWYFNRAFVLTL